MLANTAGEAVFWAATTNSERSAKERFTGMWFKVGIRRVIAAGRNRGKTCIMVFPENHPEYSRWVRVENLITGDMV